MSERKPRAVRAPDSFFRTLSDVVARREPAVLVTVMESSGSAPGKAGAKMLVTEAAHHGTVGGGRVEKATIAQAREFLGTATGPRVVSYDVVKDLGMSCGGTMRLLFEPMTPPPRLVIFGAGHISESMCAMATLAGFDVTVCDEREDWLTEERFPDARQRILADWEEAVDRADVDRKTFVASVTPGHAFDERVLHALHERDIRPRYLGVIGSRRKAAILKKDLMARGIPESEADRIRIPMGLDIGAADPPEIAVSVVAELVATLRGASEQRW
jgi:xanthine dehydrogenase accessory factor